MFADNVDYSEIPYNSRSRLETIASHVGVAVAAPVLIWATATYVPFVEINWIAVAVLYAAVVANVLLVGTLAHRAVVNGDSFEETDLWDRPTTSITLILSLSFGVFAGGLAGPSPSWRW